MDKNTYLRDTYYNKSTTVGQINRKIHSLRSQRGQLTRKNKLDQAQEIQTRIDDLILQKRIMINEQERVRLLGEVDDGIRLHKNTAQQAEWTKVGSNAEE